MTKLAATALIVAVVVLVATASLVEAKGPPARVVISGGNLTSNVVIEKADLAGIGPGFLGGSTNPPTPYASGVEMAGETPYAVTIFELDEGNQLQQFLSEHYFPANSRHPGLLTQEGKLWKVLPALSTLMDARIQSALSPNNLPSAGGPSGTASNLWAYALAAGALLLLVSAPAFACARRSS